MNQTISKLVPETDIIPCILYQARDNKRNDRTLVPAARATTVAAIAETMRLVLSVEPIMKACQDAKGTCVGASSIQREKETIPTAIERQRPRRQKVGQVSERI